MSYETILIDFKDFDRPDVQYLHRKTVMEFNESHQLIGMVRDPNTQLNQNVFGSLINKMFDSPLYGYYELLDPLEYLYPPARPYNPDDQVAYFNIPYPGLGEHIPHYDTQYNIYGAYYPYFWTHLEASDTVFAQGLLFIRPNDGGDNLKRSYMNGVSWLSAMTEAVGTSEANILGIAYIPGTDRLNT